MIGFVIRSIIAAGMLFLTVYSFYTGYWGWGISLIIPLALVILSFIYNENLAFTLNHMRTGNQDKSIALQHHNTFFQNARELT